MKVGDEVKLTAGQAELAEQTFTYQKVLDHLFERLIVESRDARVKEMELWRELEAIAKEQFGDEFDTDVYILSFNHRKKMLTVQTIEQQKKGLLK